MKCERPQIVIIGAMTRDRIIGSGNGMPWNVPEEYRHFINTTRDQTILIGRKSFDIFGADFQSRHTFVVTRSNASFPGAESCSNLGDAVENAATLGSTIYVAGGATIYQEALAVADRMLLSVIRGDYSGDVRFPDFDESLWLVADREDRGSYELFDYRRVTEPQ